MSSSHVSRWRLSAVTAIEAQWLLDKQDQGDPFTESERQEAEGLVNLAEVLSLLRLRLEGIHESAA